MDRTLFRLATCTVVAVVALAALAGSTARAQGAWVDEKGRLTADLTYEFVPSSGVVVDPEITIPDQGTTNHVFILSATYVPVERLALDISLPFEMVKYTGLEPHTPAGKWDDGALHNTLTDLRFGIRYQVLDEPPLALSPYVAASIPVMDYEVIGFATGGRHLKQLHLGVSVGRTLDPIAPNMFIAGGYELSLAEHVDLTENTKGVGQARSDIEAQLGYMFLEGKLKIHADYNWRIQHGGINFLDFGTTPIDLQNDHDQLLNEEFMFIGGGLSYEVSEKITVGALARFFLRGYNTRDQSLFGVELSWAVL